MEPRQGVKAPAFATFVVVCLGLLIVMQAGGFLLVLATGNATAPASILLGAAIACYLGWLVLLMRYLLAWRSDPSIRFGSGRKRWTVVLLPAAAVLLVLSVLTA